MGNLQKVLIKYSKHVRILLLPLLNVDRATVCRQVDLRVHLIIGFGDLRRF